MRPTRVVPLVAALALAACGGGSSSGDGAGTFTTTDAGTKIASVDDEKAGLHLEAQDNSMYAEFRKGSSPSAAVTAQRGQGLTVVCKKEDGSAVRPFVLIWRDDPGDWGVSLEVQIAYPDTGPTFAETVASCDLRADGATTGTPLATATFRG